MPNSNFTSSIQAYGEKSIMEQAWQGFIDALISGGIQVNQNDPEYEDDPAPMPAPTAEDNGNGTDVRITCPPFGLPYASHKLKYSDDGGTTWTLFEMLMSADVITWYGGYLVGRQFSIFENDLPGLPSIPLP
jgi:hypothetical protein